MQAHYSHYKTHAQCCLPSKHRNLAGCNLQEVMQLVWGDDDIPMYKKTHDGLFYALNTLSSRPSA